MLLNAHLDLPSQESTDGDVKDADMCPLLDRSNKVTKI